ncbi:MAG: ribosome-associated translation inhibitor RaiA [Myxococcota bacterium]
MQVIVKARHTSLTPALRAHAEEKLGDAVMRIFDRPAAKIEIELSEIVAKNGEDKECRVTVFMPKGRTVCITEIDDDMYKAIDLAQDRLLQQIKRARGRTKGTTRARKAARSERMKTMRENLSVADEGAAWKNEVEEYERSAAT